ncbi:hypothetical protein VV867_11775 [Pseudomonas sp. JH-2]|uniref:hypothetical protein n=1 Tax=Pseudomonas sp. JH-2 TaxID=3114998 RepID=UPI002E25D5CB|nr:hypothetical protein [Pseudomonas sp. JH-2]
MLPDFLDLAFLFAPLAVVFWVIAAFPPPTKSGSEPESDLVFPDPDGTLRTITVLFLALAIACNKANPVQGRRTGLSERAFPFGQTERRAKRTLDRAPP